MKATIRTAVSQASALLLAFGAGVAITEARSPDLSWIEGKKDLLRFMSVVHVEDGIGGTVPTVRFTGANVQIVNGLGATNGNPEDVLCVEAGETFTNGVGNLIVGYNEDINDVFPPVPAKRNGSHNIIGGIGASYSSFGGILLGRKNSLSGPYSGVLGGFGNRASGPYSAILGGGGFFGVDRNVASGEFSTISGGRSNSASGQLSHVCGGYRNESTGMEAVVVGGIENTASGNDSVVSGGLRNISSGARSQVCGGDTNEASGQDCSVSGGQGRKANGDSSWAAGSLFEDS